MIFEAKVWRGNKNGTGFTPLPKDYREKFILHDKIRAEILKQDIIFYPNLSLYKNYKGFYIPKNICKSKKLIGELYSFKIKKLDSELFVTRLGSDGRLYIPQNIANKFSLKNDDIIKIEALINKHKIIEFCKVKCRKRKNTKEYACMFSSNFRKHEGIFKIKKKLEKENISWLPKLMKISKCANIDSNKSLIIYHKSRLIINKNIKFNKKIAYYLGCYFADGTKKGYGWAITASTFDQAKYYNIMNKMIIRNSKIKSYISVTDKRNRIDDVLIKQWREKTGIIADTVRFHKTNTEKSENRNPYGSLVVRDYRVVTLLFYNGLLNYIIKKIIKEKNKIYALYFICGVLEGDGSPSAKKRGHIVIATNKDEVKILEDILKISGLEFKINRNKRITIRINSLGILKEINSLSRLIFKYYPKRRRKFIQRFSNVGAVKFILDEQDYASGWVKAYLRENGILNDKYKLTSHGKKIKESLIKLNKSITVK